MKYILPLFVGATLLLMWTGCKKSDPPPPAPPPNPCAGVSFKTTANKTHTITGQQLGTITITAPVGAGYSYSVGSGFQQSVNFFGLAAGTYKVVAKNADNCADSTNIVINGYGPKFFAVRTIINGYCGPCHLNGGNSGGKNWDDDNSIVNAYDRIKIRVVDGTPSFMPEGGQLTAPDKQKIIDWVNAGHRITD
jgi:hypothetical protein